MPVFLFKAFLDNVIMLNICIRRDTVKLPLFISVYVQYFGVKQYLQPGNQIINQVDATATMTWLNITRVLV